jgi:hypothetical protein
VWLLASQEGLSSGVRTEFNWFRIGTKGVLCEYVNETLSSIRQITSLADYQGWLFSFELIISPQSIQADFGKCHDPFLSSPLHFTARKGN